MSKPKYLPIPKKTPYNIRMPQLLLDKLNAYAELTDNTTTDVVISALNDFINDKTVFNDYLPNIKGISIKIPVLHSEKIEMYNVNLIGENSAYDLFNEVVGYEAATENYEILKIPNNLDIFNKEFGFTTPVNDVIGKGRHSGIDFIVIPENYKYYDNQNTVFCVLYCFYFEVEMDKLKSVKLIDYMDAINKATESGNETLKNRLIQCITELTDLDNEIENAEYDDYDKFSNVIYDTIKMTAKLYNTGNIIPLGENIAESVVIDELNNNPELYNVFMDDIKDNTEKYVDEVIAERIHNIIDSRLSASGIDDKSRDDILNDIKNANFKTKK